MARVPWRWQTWPMRYRSSVALVLTGALVLGFATVVGAATKPANPGQKFFRDALIKDENTSAAIRKLLESDGAIVDPVTQYSNLTDDGKSDAVVRVHSTGAAGVIAVYVFSTDGSARNKLRVVFRTQLLYRATTTITDGHDLAIDTPKYEPGDEICCPAQLTHRVYAWSPKAKKFNRTTLTTVKA